MTVENWLVPEKDRSAPEQTAVLPLTEKEVRAIIEATAGLKIDDVTGDGLAVLAKLKDFVEFKDFRFFESIWPEPVREDDDDE